MHACVFDRAAWTTGSTLDLKLGGFLRGFGLNKSLFGRINWYILIVNLHFCLPVGT